MNSLKIVAAAGLCIAALAACDRGRDTNPPGPKAGPTAAPPADTVLSKPTPDRAAAGGARAELKSASGSEVSGTVTFAESADGMRVVADVRGLTPGKHGFHLHEHGDCSAPDARSAGDHFNPDDQQHGGHDTGMRHRGDLGNLEAGANGHATLDRMVKGITLNGIDSIVGKAVLVHAGEDDLKTPPSGNSGARVACGVIKDAA